MDEELRDVGQVPEVYYWRHNPESLLTCVRVLAWYLGDSKPRVTLPTYTWKMAARLLSLTGKHNKWICPKWWRSLLKDYGIDPETFRVSDEKRFGVAWEMLNEYCEEGHPWQISVGTFKDRMKEVEQGKRAWKRASIVMIPFRSKRRERARREPEKLKGITREKAHSNMLRQRIRDFRREFEE